MTNESNKKTIKEEPVDLVVMPYSYDPVSKLFTLKVDSPNDVEEIYIQSLIHNARWRKIKFNKIYDAALKTYRQLQKWFAKLEAIIKYDNPGMKVTKELKDAFHHQMKLRIFEADSFHIHAGEEEIIMPASMKEMSVEQLARGIQVLEDTYDYVE